MKTKSIFMALLLLNFVTLNAFFPDFDDLEMRNCDGIENPLPPLNDGRIRGNFLCNNYNGKNPAWYLTNLKNDERVGSYVNFKTTPRYGGIGKFVNGDYTVTGKSILSLSGRADNVDSNKANYMSELPLGRSGFLTNVSTNDLYIPPKLQPEDIVFARAYWSGNIHNNDLSKQHILRIRCLGNDRKRIWVEKNKSEKLNTSYMKKVCNSLKNEELIKNPGLDIDCDSGIYNEYRNAYQPYGEDDYGYQTTGLRDWRIYNKSLIEEGDKKCGNRRNCEFLWMCASWSYDVFEKTRNIKISPSRIFEVSQKNLKNYKNMKISAPGLIDTPEELFSEDDDTYFSYSADGNGRGGSYFIYAASADITKFIKEVIAKDNAKNRPETTEGVRTITLAGGDIAASIGDPSTGHRRWLNGAPITFSIANFGSWSVVVVYNKPRARYNKLVADSTMKQKEKREEYKKYYKPKGVYIYDGFSTLIAPNEGNKVTKAEARFDLEGFYTPNEDVIDAKLTTYAVSMANFNRGSGYDGYVRFYDTKKNQEIQLRDARGRTNLTGIVSIVKPGEEKAETIAPWGLDRTTTAISTYDVGKYTGKQQNSTYIKYGVADTGGWGEQSFLNMIAFSTDLYVPDICYRHDIIGMSGGVNEFEAVEGETLRNIIRFENQAEKGEDAEGLKVDILFNKYTSYDKNTISINNKPGDNKPKKVIEDENNNNNNSPEIAEDMVYLADNEIGAYLKPLEFKDDGSILDGKKSNDPAYKDKKLNTVEIKNIEGLSVDDIGLYIGRGAGVVENNKIIGGALKFKERVYVDFNSTIGKYFKPLNFKLSFSYKVSDKSEYVTVTYDDDIPTCSDVSNNEKKIKVFPLSGLRVVNHNFNTESDLSKAKYTNLHTQIVNKDFKTKLIYRVDPGEQALAEYGEGENKIYTIIDDYGEEKNVTKSEFDFMYKDFKLKGDLELSLITSDLVQQKGCKNILDKDKIPFAFPGCPSDKIITTENGKEKETNINCNDLNTKYQINFKNNNNDIINLYRGNNGINIGYARQDYEFMVSYKPSKLERKDLENTDSSSNDNSSNEGEDTNSGIVNKHNIINVCTSDSFAVRPASIKVGDINTSNVRVAGDPRQNDDILQNSFYPVDLKGNYIGGYNSKIGDLSDEDAKTNPNFLIPNLPVGCNADNVISPNTGKLLWSEGGVPVKIEFLKFDSNGTKLEGKYIYDELDKYKNSKELQRTYSQVYTDENLTTGVREFNYYNIGDVNLTILDTAWTYLDQKGDDNISRGCVLGESFDDPSKDPDGLGRVGCDIATDRNLTLKFKHDRVDINILGLRNSVDGDYTYYDSSNRFVNRVPVDTNVSRMSALLDMNATAYLKDNDFHKNVIPTLYNSKCYARDVRFGLDFNFDCSDGSGVGNRCIDIGLPADKNLDQICSENIGDSRCYKDIRGARIGLTSSIIFDGRGGIDSVERNDFNATSDFIVTAATKLNIINRVSDNNFTNSQIPAFEASRGGFNDGINNSAIAINFQRFPNIANNPTMIYAEDFIQNQGMNLREMPLPTDTKVDPLTGLNTANIVANSVNFIDYNRTFANAGTIVAPTRDVAYFYYGYINAENDEYTEREDKKEGIDARIVSTVFCDDNNTGNCTTSPFAVLRENREKNATKIRNNFYQNVLKGYAGGIAGNIKSDFVDEYSTNNREITTQRGNVLNETTDFFENLNITTRRATTAIMNVNTNSWFVYDGASPLATRNSFNVIFTPTISGWGGQGTTKDGDNVGIFLDNNGSAKNIKPEQGRLRRSNRLNW